MAVGGLCGCCCCWRRCWWRCKTGHGSHGWGQGQAGVRGVRKRRAWRTGSDAAAGVAGPCVCGGL
eukprot:1141157-Pelagomonas_calceolata.AAC.2